MSGIKKWLRKKYIIWKYKHNWNTGKVIVLGQQDRGYGLTTMMLKDCIKHGYVLFFPYEADKKIFYSSAEDKERFDKYLLSKMDVKMGAHKHTDIKGVIMDNHCTYEDVKFLYGNNLAIVNGFIYVDVSA